MVKFTLPVLVRVNAEGELVVSTVWLPKFNNVLERVAMEAVPVPVNVIDWGAPGALSAILTVAERPRMAVGVNVTVIEQVPLGATGLTQVLVCAKSPGLAPVTEMLVMVKLALPVLVSVTL